MDIFTAARFKIALLYFLMGVVALALGGYLLYVSSSVGLILGLLFILVAIVAYVLAWITLRPIERAVAQQRRFMANISHELRTPLSVMRTNSEATLLGALDLSREELMETLGGNLEEVDRMAKIIEFLLVFSNLENRLSKLSLASVDVSGVAVKAMTLVQPMVDQKGIGLTLNADPGAIVRGNATALEEMMVNLLKNAVSYTPPQGSVRLGVSKSGYDVTLAVEDTGVGIPEKDLPNIFEPFFRGDNGSSQKKDANAGLGLAIVREIAGLHRATVEVKSQVGRGTVISIKFPRKLFSR